MKKRRLSVQQCAALRRLQRDPEATYDFHGGPKRTVESLVVLGLAYGPVRTDGHVATWNGYSVTDAGKERRLPKSPIDWDAVAAVMLKSFRGERRTDEEERLTTDAYRRSPKRYATVHLAVRRGEITRIRTTGCP